MGTQSTRRKQTPKDWDDSDGQSEPSRNDGNLGLPEGVSLDTFLGEMFQDTKTGQESGMPSLSWLKEHFKTKSAAIRYLHIDRGYSVNDIRKHLDLRYQHVRNVLKKELKRGPNEDFHLAEGQAAEAFRGEGNDD